MNSNLQFRHSWQTQLPPFWQDSDWWKCVAINSTYGFTVIGNPYGVIFSLWNDQFEQRKPNILANLDDSAQRRLELWYLSEVAEIKFNCNESLLAITENGPDAPHVYLFNAATFSPRYDEKPYPLTIVDLSESPILITTFEWNLVNPALFVVATTETLTVVSFSLKDATNHRILGKKELEVPVTTVSWNAKGTSLTVGDTDGKIHRYNPKLEILRSVEPPTLIPSVFETKFSCSGLCQVSKTQCIVVFTSETSAHLHLMLLTLRGKKPPFWRVWDVLPPAADPFAAKTFNFLPVFGWDMVMMSSTCLTDVFTFGRVNGAWKPLELTEPFFIRTPIYNGEKTFIVDTSICFSSTKSVEVGQFGQISSPLPVVYVLTSNITLLVYHLALLDPNRPNLWKPVRSIDTSDVKNGPKEEHMEATDYVQRMFSRPDTLLNSKDAETQTNKIKRESASAFIIRMKQKEKELHTLWRLVTMKKLTASGVLEVYADENPQFNQIKDIKTRWEEIFTGDQQLLRKIKPELPKLTAEQCVGVVYSIFKKPVSKKPSLNIASGLTVRKASYSTAALTILKAVCDAISCPFAAV
uniref:Nuclear pore complex protein Nup88 n=1 Tax=Panagrellus redivivus TaxID=6233 RepID=A0A7E4ZYD2_PANRE